MKFLKEENLVLIGTNSSKIVVFDLWTLKYVFNPMNASKMMSIDCLNREFSVAQCDINKICLFSVNLTKSLQVTKIFNFNQSCTIFSIKIINQTFIVFGIEIVSERISRIGMWNLEFDEVKQMIEPTQVLEVFDHKTLVYEKRGNIKLANLTNFSNDTSLGNLGNVDIILLKRIYPKYLIFFSNNYEKTTI